MCQASPRDAKRYDSACTEGRAGLAWALTQTPLREGGEELVEAGAVETGRRYVNVHALGGIVHESRGNQAEGACRVFRVIGSAGTLVQANPDAWSGLSPVLAGRVADRQGTR